MMFLPPAVLEEVLQHSPLQVPRRLVIQILGKGGLVLKTGDPQHALGSSVFAIQNFPIYQVTDALLKGQFRVSPRLFQLFLVGRLNPRSD